MAFANSGGGHIIVGVDNDGKVLGISDINNQILRLESIARNCDPPVPLRISSHTRDEKDILDRKELKWNLMENVKQAMIFLKKHLPLRYEIKGLKRQEFLEIPEEALREAVLNAVMHRDYHFDTAWITVEIYRDQVEISDPRGLPPGMRPEDLGKKSVHGNKMIADLFHRMGEVEKAGSGINCIRDMMATRGLSEPRFEFTSFFTIIFNRKTQIAPQVTPQVRKMLGACKEPRSRVEILHILGLSDQEHLRKAYIRPALEAEWLAMTIPDKPRSSKQRYVTTEKGRKVIVVLGYDF